MYFVPVLLAVDAPDPMTAEAIAHGELRERAVFVGGAREMSAEHAGRTAFELIVLADNVELPPAGGPHDR